MINNPYIDFVLKHAPRILSQIDRDSDSPTYGCCDRNFWHYKIRDFPSAILQQAGLALAILYNNDFKGNIYFKKKEIKDIALATLLYWQKIQHRDGSFDEYWPNEHGIPPTAFTLFSASELCRILGVKDKIIFSAISKSALYLLKHREKNALNQEIAASCAVYSASLTIGSPKLRKAAESKMRKVISLQNKEGWFAEYGGADIGYLSVSLNYMSEYYLLSKNQQAKNAAKKIIDFIKHFVHPDGSFGGDYGSRNTEYFLPAGFEIVSRIHPIAGSIADKMMEYSKSNFSLDDRYLCHYVFYSFTKALVMFKPKKIVNLPYESNFSVFFKEAGIYIKSTSKFYFISALSKGGTFAAFNKKTGKRVLNDCGYRAFVGKKLYVTNWLSDDYTIIINKNKITLNSWFYKVKFHTPTPLQHFVLRCSSLFLGRKIIPLMKKVFIFSSKKSGIVLSKTIRFEEGTIDIDDRIESKKEMDRVERTERLSLRFCPSSRYYQNSSLGINHYPFEEKCIKKAHSHREIKI